MILKLPASGLCHRPYRLKLSGIVTIFFILKSFLICRGPNGICRFHVFLQDIKLFMDKRSKMYDNVIVYYYTLLLLLLKIVLNFSTLPMHVGSYN